MKKYCFSSFNLNPATPKQLVLCYEFPDKAEQPTVMEDIDGEAFDLDPFRTLALVGTEIEGTQPGMLYVVDNHDMHKVFASCSKADFCNIMHDQQAMYIEFGYHNE